MSPALDPRTGDTMVRTRPISGSYRPQGWTLSSLPVPGWFPVFLIKLAMIKEDQT